MLSGMCTHSGTICSSFYGSPVRYQVLCDVTRHFNQPFGNLPGFEHRRVIHQKLFRSTSIIVGTLNFEVKVLYHPKQVSPSPPPPPPPISTQRNPLVSLHGTLIYFFSSHRAVYCTDRTARESTKADTKGPDFRQRSSGEHDTSLIYMPYSAVYCTDKSYPLILYYGQK